MEVTGDDTTDGGWPFILVRDDALSGNTRVGGERVEGAFLLTILNTLAEWCAYVHEQEKKAKKRIYSPNNSRKRLVCARLTGISVCFLSSMRIW